MSYCSFAANTVRLQLHAPAYNLANFMRTLAPPETGIGCSGAHTARCGRQR